MVMQTRAQREQLLITRLQVAFEPVFPHATNAEIEEFAVAFFMNRFREQNTLDETVTKARLMAAVAKIYASEPNLNQDDISMRVTQPLRAVLEVIIREKHDQLVARTNQWVVKRERLEKQIRQYAIEISAMELHLKMANILQRISTSQDLDAARVSHNQARAELEAEFTKYMKDAAEIQDGI